MRCVAVALVCLALAAGLGRSQDSQLITLSWNHAVDFILAESRNQILLKNLDEVPLADAYEQFHRKWGFFLVDAEFEARQGHLRSLSSLERRGEATVEMGGSKITLKCEVGLREAKVRYEKYEVSLWRESILSGEINGNIATNKMRVVIDFELNEEGCTPFLREVKVTEIGGFEVQVSGIGPLDGLASQISTWVSKKREGQVVKELEYYLSKEIRKALEVFDCGLYTSQLLL